MIALVLIFAALIGQGSSTFPASPEDLVAYRDALKASTIVPSKSVRFEDLWERGDGFRGQRVEIQGRVVRSFEAEASGELPAREEVWLSQGQNLICAVVPLGEDRSRVGEKVSIDGIYLGHVKYQGGDGPRLAPLVVGSESPRRTLYILGAGESWISSPLIVTIIVAGLILIALARFWSKRPRGKPSATHETLEFLS